MRNIRWLVFVFFIGNNTAVFAGSHLSVVMGRNATPMEDYAAKELCRYVYGLTAVLPEISSSLTTDGFIIGRPGHSALIDQLITKKKISANRNPQGYTIKSLKIKGRNVIVIAGADDTGLLYGVYGFLEEHMGVSFGFDGDVYPKERTVDELFAEIDESKTPEVAIRGFLPWTNFPQSATSYSWGDWKYILDQMAKMRMNFLQIHNYTGEEGHNEMFENFEVDGKMSRVWMATARSGHAWGSYPGWDVNKYQFGSSNLFDDYDFGADCALHNEGLDDKQVFRKGANEFQRVIAYAHTRGIKIGLGLDINLIPAYYKLNPDDPAVITGRVKQIESDYPDLDYLLCFQSEGLSDPAAVKERRAWRTIFDGFYNGLRKTMPNLRLAVAGWGIRPEDVATLPEDVICAPISYYSDGFESGAAFGTREYWGCPWLERDFSSSVYYYPYHMDISNTVTAWQNRAPNMKGFYSLTWRITDAIKPKLWYMSRAPWDSGNELSSSEIIYQKFARQQYGEKAAGPVTPIINQNEPFATDFSECRWTPPFSLARVDPGRSYLINLLSFRLNTGSKPSPVHWATDFAKQDRTKNGEGVNGKESVGYITDGSWLSYKEIDFNETADQFSFSYSSATDGGKIELRLDNPSGTLIGETEAIPTGSWQKWKESIANILPVHGKHDLFLVFHDREAMKMAQIQLDKAVDDLARIDCAVIETENAGQRYRLNLLKSRISAERDHILLNMYAGSRGHDIQTLCSSWINDFNSRVTDISSLGNIVSVQNRFIQKNYRDLAWKQINTYNTLAPENVEAKGTLHGIRISWKTDSVSYRGFDIYRDGKKISNNILPADSRQYEDSIEGFHEYEVYSYFCGNEDANASIGSTAVGGDADQAPPQIILISPPGSILEGQPVWIKVDLLDNRIDDLLSAKLFYRRTGTREWNSVLMTRKIKTTFTAVIPENEISGAGLEYYILASDGTRESVFPADAPDQPLSLIQEKSANQTGLPAPILKMENNRLLWKQIKSAFYYRIYRSDKKEFNPGPENCLTYVSADAYLSFTDNGKDFKGEQMHGDWYYKITAVDKNDYEGHPSGAVLIRIP